MVSDDMVAFPFSCVAVMAWQVLTCRGEMLVAPLDCGRKGQH